MSFPNPTCVGDGFRRTLQESSEIVSFSSHLFLRINFRSFYSIIPLWHPARSFLGSLCVSEVFRTKFWVGFARGDSVSDVSVAGF